MQVPSYRLQKEVKHMEFFTTTNLDPSVPSSSTSHSASKDKRKKKGANTTNTSATRGNNNNNNNNNGVKLSTDPQSVAARERRHRISNRFKILQSLVPGGSKMDTVSMLEEAINYVKFLQNQLLLHQTIMNLDDHDPSLNCNLPVNIATSPLQQPSFIDETHQDYYFFSDLGTTQPTNLLPLPDTYFQFKEEATIAYDGFLEN